MLLSRDEMRMGARLENMQHASANALKATRRLSSNIPEIPDVARSLSSGKNKLHKYIASLVKWDSDICLHTSVYLVYLVFQFRCASTAIENRLPCVYRAQIIVDRPGVSVYQMQVNTSSHLIQALGFKYERSNRFLSPILPLPTSSIFQVHINIYLILPRCLSSLTTARILIKHLSYDLMYYFVHGRINQKPCLRVVLECSRIYYI